LKANLFEAAAAGVDAEVVGLAEADAVGFATGFLVV
jgi:hypothetical protein